MLDNQVKALYDMILKALPGTANLERAVAEVQGELNQLGLSGPRFEESLGQARSLVQRQLEEIQILRKRSVHDKRPQWYFGPPLSSKHWPAVRKYLLDTIGWSEQSVGVLDESSNEVVSLLANPGQASFGFRGLVVGYVQSGKTANMTAVIAKALDVGYNTVIVLAGVTNKLRLQTQRRLVADLVERHPLDWQVLTPGSVDGDFKAPPHGGFLSHTDKAQLAVVKKNVSPLRQLGIAIEKTLPAALAKLRILLIDDECDQASVNSAKGELDMTEINKSIRRLLKALPAVSYVGYTATPFANVLINPYPGDSEDLDDLYPKDFITALPLPEEYFGTEKLFGKPPEDPENVLPEEEGLDMIRSVPEEEHAELQPANRKAMKDFTPRLVPTLEDALLYFLACCAARRVRGDADRHMTMLVHTSASVGMHERVAALIRSWKETRAEELLTPDSDLSRRLGAVWSEEQGRLPSNLHTAQGVSIDLIAQHLPEVLAALEVAVENGPSEYRIDYTTTAKTYIVVGGTILARGLTLEGLMVSYFLRPARQYDTLLQMGRWFGYRPGYEDLPRIWMPDELRMRFRALAGIESEVREEIARYAAEDKTPMEIAVRIRSIPGLAITGASKMRAASTCAISFWGSHRQTVRFEHRDEAKLRHNWGVGAELVGAASELGKRDPGRASSLWRGVPREAVLDFLRGYRTHPTDLDLSWDLLGAFVEGADNRLDRWNVGIVEPHGGKPSAEALGAHGTVRLVNRAPLKGGGRSADIKALMSRKDVWFDCDGPPPANGSWDDLKMKRMEPSQAGSVPLLLLYAIDRHSKPATASNVREPLEATHDILAYGLVFPGSKTEGGTHVSVNLRQLSVEDLEELEAEELEESEAAGVA